MDYTRLQLLCATHLLVLQMVFIASGLNITSLDLGQTITRVTSRDFSDIYVGGVNFVAQLSDRLELMFNMTIGPVKSARNCAPHSAPCDNNVTVLEVDAAHNKLLVCGSAYNGTCTLHNLNYILEWDCLYGELNKDGAEVMFGIHNLNSAVHFIQPSTVKLKSLPLEGEKANCRTEEFGLQNDHMKYSDGKSAKVQAAVFASDKSSIRHRSVKVRKLSKTGTVNAFGNNAGTSNIVQKREVTEENGMNFENEESSFQSNLVVAGGLHNPNSFNNPPFLSLRHINFINAYYSIGYQRIENSSPVGIRVQYPHNSSIIPDYKLSFAWEDYSYFVFLQQTTECGDGRPKPCIVTKISRTCHSPSSFLPYVEIAVSCLHKNKGFHLLTSATLGTVGLKIESSDVTIPVLVMTFGNGYNRLSTTADPKLGTALCVITLNTLDKVEFNFLLDTCSNTRDNNGLAKHVTWIVGKHQDCQQEGANNGKCTSNTKNQYVQSTGFTELDATAFLNDVTAVMVMTHTHTVTTNSERKPIPVEKMDIFLLTNKGYFQTFSVRANRNIMNDFSVEVTRSSDGVNLGEDIISQPTGITDHSRAIMYISSGHDIMKLDLEFCLQFRTCSDCLQNDKCRWCQEENNCRDEVISQSVCRAPREKRCSPIIEDVNPKTVPTDGGTMLTLTGVHLGVQGQGNVSVQVCGIPCDNTVANQRNVTCTLRNCSSCSSKCNITITVLDQLKSNGSYTLYNTVEYVTIKITSFSPKFGPVFGGTVISIHGQNVNAGRSRHVTVGQAPCIVIPDMQHETKDLLCRIMEDSKRQPYNGSIMVTIDKFNKTLTKEKFGFRPNPTIKSLKPQATIASGGITITVTGTYLSSVASPVFKLTVLYIPSGSNSSSTSVFHTPCRSATNGKTMTCKTPDVSEIVYNIVNATITLYMDGTDLMTRLSVKPEMIVYKDPVFFVLAENTYIPRGSKTFTLTGERIPSWIDYSDIVVSIGRVTVKVIEVKSNHIVCDITNAVNMYDDEDTEDSDNYSTAMPLSNETNTTDNNTSYRTVVPQQRNVTENTISHEANVTDNTNSNETIVTDSTISYETNVTNNTAAYTNRYSFQTNVTDNQGYKSSVSSKPILNSTKATLKPLIRSNYIKARKHRSSEIQDSKYNVFGNETKLQATSRSPATTTSKNGDRQKTFEYNITIRIGNYKKDLGYVVIGPDLVSINHASIKLIAGAVSAGVVFLILVIVSCVMYIRAKKADALVKEQAFYMGSLSGSQHGSKEAAFPTLKQILHSVMDPEKREDMDRLIISLDRLTVGKTIGSGNFGCVFEGFLSMDKESEAQKVAVKTLQDPSSHNLNLREFVQEAVLMRDFQHPHVLGLIGLAEKEPGIPYVILPYMDKGDLLTFVRDSSVSLSLYDVIKFGADIASGMAYISALKFVHRDLAARNCMLDDHYRVKVADFGLCRDIYEKGYYTSDNRKKLPIRWMAVESIEQGAYSSKSDVWSLGVVLWELLSRGVTPYPGVNGWDIINFLRHRRLAPPYFCPDEMYNLMMRCWAKDPNNRPEFTTVQTELLSLIGQSPSVTDTMKRKRGDNLQSYVNLPVKGGPAVQDSSVTVVDKMTKSTEKSLKSEDGKNNVYVNSSPSKTVVVKNVLITIPTCYSNRDISKTAAGTYLQLVDNYEPPPKFSNPLLRSMKISKRKSHDRHRQGGLKKDDGKTEDSGYSFPGEYPPTQSSAGDINKGGTEGNAMTRDSQKMNYYELETTSLRSSAASENRSAWSMLNNTSSCQSILDTESQDSSMSTSVASTTSLPVPQIRMSQLSSQAAGFKKLSPFVDPDRSLDSKQGYKNTISEEQLTYL